MAEDTPPQHRQARTSVSANAQLVDDRFAGAVSPGQLNQPSLRRNVRHLAGNSQGTALEADMNGGNVEFQVRFAFERCLTCLRIASVRCMICLAQRGMKQRPTAPQPKTSRERWALPSSL